VLAGTVAGLTCGPIDGARVDLWQADDRGAMAPATDRRAHQVTDKDGRYSFSTIVPGAAAGRAPRLNLRVAAPAKGARGARTLVTAAFFPEDARNAADPLFHPQLVMKAAPAVGGTAAYVFDLILDV
jgi:protocatechuate 3,4-dioxygenase beta subunit